MQNVKQWTGKNWQELFDWIGSGLTQDYLGPEVFVNGRIVYKLDFIVKQGEDFEIYSPQEFKRLTGQESNT